MLELIIANFDAFFETTVHPLRKTEKFEFRFNLCEFYGYCKTDVFHDHKEATNFDLNIHTFALDKEFNLFLVHIR